MNSKSSLFRRVWRWHFWAGVLACPTLFLVALTGAIYTFRDDLEDVIQADLRFVTPTESSVSLSEQLAACQREYPDWKPKRITVFNDPSRATMIQVARADLSSGQIPAVFVNPHTGEVVGEGPERLPFFLTVIALHQNLLAGQIGRYLVELTTSWTLVLVVSGIYLWWPRVRTKILGVWLPRLRSKNYVVLRDLHSLGGMATALVVVVLSITGLFFSPVWLPLFNKVSNNAGNMPERPVWQATLSPDAVTSTDAERLDETLRLAREHFPSKNYRITLPSKKNPAYDVTPRYTNGVVAGSLLVHAETGEVVQLWYDEELSFAEQLRLYVLPTHKGTIGGTATQVLAFLSCLSLAGLAISGVWMWMIRRRGWRTGFPRASNAPVPTAGVALILVLAVALPTVGLSLLVVLAGEFIYDSIRSVFYR